MPHSRLDGMGLAHLNLGESSAHRCVDRTLGDIRGALEDAGVVFIDEDEEGPGVRLRKSRNDEPQRIQRQRNPWTRLVFIYQNEEGGPGVRLREHI